MCDLAERYQANVVNLEVPAGQGYSLEQLTAAVEQHKPAVLFVVQGESSTGVQQSLAGAGPSCGVLWIQAVLRPMQAVQMHTNCGCA